VVSIGRAPRVGVAELPESALPLSERAAVGSPAEVVQVIRSFAEAGASTVVLQPTADDPDVAATIRLAANARAALLSL
jgi:alkanesulfonate monooxygenase SsuD/methylene tetrahydromethanopterin reductase-like flavin-dependent oxidoreductase (luciferase family)